MLLRVLDRARCFYDAYLRDDPDAVAVLLTDDFRFSSPADVDLDRAGYFERCWPNAGRLAAIEIVRCVEAGDETVVTLEVTRADGSRFRNTEVMTFAGDKLRRVEVYFGWDLK
jgi:hypothetical protein